jgi:hypothetical protein
MKFEYEDSKVYRPASIDRIGPVIVVTCCDQEFVATIQCCSNSHLGKHNHQGR